MGLVFWACVKEKLSIVRRIFSQSSVGRSEVRQRNINFFIFFALIFLAYLRFRC